jgi:hypothetical protein
MLFVIICAMTVHLLSSSAQQGARPKEIEDFELTTSEVLLTAPFFFSVAVDVAPRGQVIIGAIAPAGPEARAFTLTRLEAHGGHTQLRVSDAGHGAPFRLQGVKGLEDGSTLFAAECGTRIPRLLRVGRNGVPKVR